MRKTHFYLAAPISTNLILSYIAEYVLGLPRSFQRRSGEPRDRRKSFCRRSFGTSAHATTALGG
ncbi:MAG: hypothetical protein HYX46_09440 [Betaproteobacteria bacterium]|nr:hypothetical protein [Betaproteobacteria bacterium]